MEEKKYIKISLGTLLLLIFTIVLLIAIIAIGVFMFSSKMINKNDTSSNLANNDEKIVTENKIDEIEENIVENVSKNTVKNSLAKSKIENKVESKVENEDLNSAQYVGKIVESRGYIYDAQYGFENLANENYKTNDNVSYSISDIVVPYININSDDGKNSDSELEEAYKNFVDEFKVCSENKNSYIKVNYKSYTISNIVSIIITIERGKEENITNEYLAYNFDLISGSRLNYEQTYTIAGINNIGECVKNNIEELDEFKNDSDSKKKDSDNAKIEADIEECKQQVYTYYQEDLLNNKLVYFLDNNLKLNISLRIVTPEDESGNRKLIEKLVIINN